MSGSNLNHAAFFFLFVFFVASFKLSFCLKNNGITCPEIERQSLLNFKQSLKDPENLLSSWDGAVDCCKWKGVVCNNFTGHVHQLHLRGRNLEWFLFPYQFKGLSGKINPSLVNLKHLRYLDLSENNFEETIPSFIGLFRNLEYLNLSIAGFHGKIPHSIGNLSNLHTLALQGFRSSFDTKGYNLDLALDADSLEWFSGLSKLEYLNMNSVNLSKATNWPAQVINSLPSLLELHFAGCVLNFSASLSDVNITSLTQLDLSHNYYSQSFAIPIWIFQLTNLLSLDLSLNFLEGPIPTISNATKLQYVDLSDNQFNSSIPHWLYFCIDLEFVSLSDNLLQGTISNAIGNLTSLNSLELSLNQLSGKLPREITNLCKIHLLDLFYNEFEGEISDSFGNMTECFLGALEYLSLEGNKLSGNLIDQFGEFKNLQVLNLGRNLLSGAIPNNLGKISSLYLLLLHGNKFSENLPECFVQLFNLEGLYINDNMLEGVVTESHFANLTNLQRFSASRNHLTLKVSRNWIPSFQLSCLRLGSWNLGNGSHIPLWLETQKNMDELDLSNTGISGNVPSWFWEIQCLNLSNNHLHGKIPYMRGTGYMYLSSNQFSGTLPRIENTIRQLDLSNNLFSGGISHFLCDKTHESYELEILHLEKNQLCGELPDCWMKWPSLRYLSLGNNNMSGNIPNSMWFLVSLMSLNLNNNKFLGQIPLSMHNCTKLVKIDLANNDLKGSIPTWMGTSLVMLRILILRSNKLTGMIPLKICCLNSLQILDLSNNNFSGIIPRCVYNFTAMVAKRRSDEGYSYTFWINSSLVIWTTFRESASIATKGRKLEYDIILPLVTNIDFSKNNLSGEIPKELTSLVELRSLNLSENHLTGFIPKGIGAMKQLESLDLSRNYLSGRIPNSFKLMFSLDYLNLSCNNLVGRIPESTQLQSFDALSFIGNNLCGPPLTSNCSHHSDKVRGHKEDNESDESEIEWFYIFLSLGYALGFSLVCTTLVLKKSWRRAYFESLECVWNKLYVYVYIKWTRLTKPSGPNS